MLRTAADRLAEQLALRPVAYPLAVLAHLTALLRERADATVVLEADRPERLVGLLETADLARARLDAERPPAGTSSLAAQRAAQSAPDLPVLRAAAAGGDLLRARELTTCGLVAGPWAEPADELRARTMLALAGMPLLPELLEDDPAAAARTLVEAEPTAAADPSPVLAAVQGGAELRIALPRTRRISAPCAAVTSSRCRRPGSAGGSRAPRSLGMLRPGAIAADASGRVIATFEEDPGPA